MARVDRTQLNIRSAYARERTRELAKLTGMTATQIVEIDYFGDSLLNP